MEKVNKMKGITLIALVITIIVLLILAGISIQSITNTGIFEKASQAKKEATRSQIIEWLSLKLLEEQTYNPLGTSEEIIKATRQNVYNNISELQKMGKMITVGDTKTEENGEQVDIYFYVQVDEDVYKVDIKGAQFKSGNVADAPSNTETYTISYDANGGEGAPESQIKYYGVDIQLSTIEPTRDGYTFLGWAEDSTATSATYEAGVTYSSNSNATLYAVWKINTLSESITASNYGDKVNYSVTVNSTYILDDWKIFYNDKETETVYMIYGDCILNDTGLAKNAGIGTSNTTHKMYCVYSNAGGGAFQTMLTDTSRWTSLLTEELSAKGAVAKGAVDLETWVASWNEKNYTKIYTEANSFGTTENPTGTYTDLTSTDGFNDTLYFPTQSSHDGCDGYWMSTLIYPSYPSSDGWGFAKIQYTGSIGIYSCGPNQYEYNGWQQYDAWWGLRPIICLPSSVFGTQLADGSWNIE